MWISKEKYQALKQLAKDNERDAATFRDVMLRLQVCSAITHTDFLIMKPEIWHKFSDKMTQLEDENKDLAAELEWYKVKYHEIKTNKSNDYYKGAKDFIEWLLTNDKYSACTIDTDEACILCDVGLTKDMWTEPADKVFKEFAKEIDTQEHIVLSEYIKERVAQSRQKETKE
jgi:hypothetical protein